MRLSDRKFQILARQIFWSKPTDQGIFSHPMNSNVGTKAFVAVEHAVKTDHDLGVIWKSKLENEVQSTVECLQIYSDKSQTLLSGSLLSFYSIHITLLNSTENMRRKQIVSGASLPAYLPFGCIGSDLGTRRK